MSQDVLSALLLTGKGMLGIFVVMVVIALLVTLLSKVTAGREKKED